MNAYTKAILVREKKRGGVQVCPRLLLPFLLVSGGHLACLNSRSRCMVHPDDKNEPDVLYTSGEGSKVSAHKDAI